MAKSSNVAGCTSAEAIVINWHSKETGAKHASENVVELNTAPNRKSPVEDVKFTRQELDQILRVYSFMVAGGDWRDYGISHLRDRAVFSIFRRASEMPLFRIEKNPKNTRRQGAYAIIAPTGQILKRGHELPTVLRYFDKKISLVQSR